MKKKAEDKLQVANGALNKAKRKIVKHNKRTSEIKKAVVKSYKFSMEFKVEKGFVIDDVIKNIIYTFM